MQARREAKSLIIALDGPAASGKGTLAKRIAARFGLPHLDTGLLYRGVGRGVLDLGKDPGDAAAAVEVASKLDLAALDEDRLRGAEMGEAASRVAAIPEVRAMLLDLQRRFAGQPGGAVLDGRDIGTVICPDATVKIFVTATPEVRAERRFKELKGRGEAVTFEDVLADIRRRDAARFAPQRRPAGGRSGCALARYHRFRYRRGVSGGPRHHRSQVARTAGFNSPVVPACLALLSPALRIEPCPDRRGSRAGPPEFPAARPIRHRARVERDVSQHVTPAPPTQSFQDTA